MVWVSGILNALIDASEEGARFLFGPILVARYWESRVGPDGAGRWIARALTPPVLPQCREIASGRRT